MTTSAHTDTIAQLRSDLGGRVIEPDDAAYDEARTVFYGGIDRRPAAIARPGDALQVAQVVAAARESGLALAVRGGGHSLAGHSVVDDGIVLDLSALRDLEVGSDRLTASAGAGMTASEYTNAVGEHGLATGFGDTGSVGIGGLTLGGGVGYLSRAHGLTVDDLLAAELVTADGAVVEVDADRDPDLFWALRGGGGNFGVATRFTFRVHELESVVGGMLLLPATAEALHAFIGLAEEAPDELSAIANVAPAPPLPFLPAEVHGQLVIMALICYAGPPEAGERALAPFRAIASPIADMVRPIPYPEIYPPDQEGLHPTAVARTMFIDGVDRDTATAIVDYVQSSDAAMRVVQLRVLGGAIARVPSDATAYAHRQSRIMANIAAFYDGAEERAAREAWVEEVATVLRQSDDGAYVNFLGDEGPERVRAAYPGSTWDRLRAIKARHDPTNLFRGNQNVPPDQA